MTAPASEAGYHGPLRAGEFSRALRVLGLLSVEAAGLILLLPAITSSGWIVRFVARNELEPVARGQLLQQVAVGSALVLLATGGALAVSWRRRGPTGVRSRLDFLSWLARLFAPALVLWALPQLMVWKAWVGRELVLLLSAAAVVLLVEPALVAAFSAARELRPPAFFSKWVARAKSRGGGGGVRWTPHVATGAATLGYIAYASYYTVLQHHARQTTGFDLGGYSNFFWNTLHGRAFYCPIFHPRDTLYLMIHTEPAVYLLAPFYALRSDAATLLVIQAVLMGSAAVPLYLFARARLRTAWLPVVIALAYLLFPALHASNFYDFHFLAIAPFFVLWAAYFLERGRLVWFWVAAVSALACREDVAIGAAIVGAALVLSGHRLRTGVALTILATAYFAAVKFFLMPKFGEPSFVHHYARLVAPGQRGFTGVFETLITNPLYGLSVVVTQEKLRYLLHLFVPLAFLPFRDKRVWFLLLPGGLITLLSTDAPPLTDIRYQYVAHFIPYVFVATVLVCARLKDSAPRPKQLAAAGAMIAGTAIMTGNFGAFNQRAFTSGHGKVLFAMTEQQRESLVQLRDIAKTIPPTGSLAATERDTPHVAQREHLFTLKYQDQGDADYLLYAYDDLDYGAARALIQQSLRAGTHGLHAERPGYVVLRRGAPTDRNLDLLSRLQR